MILRSIPVLLFLLFFSQFAVAQEEPAQASGKQPQQENPVKKQPTEEELAALFSKITKDPENLDLNFKYAQMATALGKFDEALAAYERMLIVNPDLSRVKLDMALLYMRMGSYPQAKKLFEEVLEKDPPKPVRANIGKMMAQIRQSEKRHILNYSLTTGMNSDTNATSTPDTGSVDLFGVSVPLDDTSGRAGDDHTFTAFSANHTYILPGKKRHIWKTTGSIYKTWQSSLRNLDITVASLKTGPTFNVPRLRSKFGFDLGYNDTNLGESNYLISSSQTVRAEHAITPRMLVKADWTREKRRFRNTATSTTFELRNGHTNQQKIGATISLTKQDILNVDVTFKQEVTKTKFNDNRQQGINLSHTHIFPNGYFSNTAIGLKKTQYKGIDVLVNPSTIRRDIERSLTVSVGKKITKSLTGTLSYQQRNINSTLQNFEYKNERVSAVLSWQF